MKKGGIIVGLVILALAGIIYWLAPVGEDANQEKPVVVEKVKAPVKQEVVQQPVKEVVKSETVVKSQTEVVKNTEETKPLPLYQNTFTEVSESSLGSPTYSSTELMVVSKKKMLVMDTAVGTDGGKQLLYAVEMIGGSTPVTLYLNGGAYSGLVLGDKLSITYTVYENIKGIKFPVVLGVEKAT